MSSKRIIFFGTPKIAEQCLETLYELNLDICAVVTKPDKPVGRKKEIMPSPVKKLALKKNTKLFQPENVLEITDELINLKPEIIFTCAYGKIIPQKLFSYPRCGCINIHTSLLPKYRGGAPIHWAIINGEKETGVTFMYTNEKLDTGDILFQESVKITDTETYKTLYEKLTKLSQKMLRENIENIFKKNITPQKQNHDSVSYAKNITRGDEKISWNKSSNEIDCLIRGLYDSPIAFTIYNGMSIKVLKAKISDLQSNKKPGTIMHIDLNGIVVATADKAIVLEIIQLPSKTPTEFKNIYNGKHCFKLGEMFE